MKWEFKYRAFSFSWRVLFVPLRESCEFWWMGFFFALTFVEFGLVFVFIKLLRQRFFFFFIALVIQSHDCYVVGRHWLRNVVIGEKFFLYSSCEMKTSLRRLFYISCFFPIQSPLWFRKVFMSEIWFYCGFENVLEHVGYPFFTKPQAHCNKFCWNPILQRLHHSWQYDLFFYFFWPFDRVCKGTVE